MTAVAERVIVIPQAWGLRMDVSWNLWKTFATREAAQTYLDEAPEVGMHIVSKPLIDGLRTDWTRA